MSSAPSNANNPYAAPLPTSGAEARGLEVTPGGDFVLVYDLTVDDLVDFAVFHHFRSRIGFRQRVYVYTLTFVFSLLFIVIAVPFVGALVAQANLSPTWILGTVLGGFFALMSVLIYRRKHNLRRVIQRVYAEGNSDTLTGWHRLTLSEAFVRVESAYIVSHIRCTGFRKIARSPGSICWYYSAVNATVIPLRAFANESEIERFIKTAEKYMLTEK